MKVTVLLLTVLLVFVLWALYGLTMEHNKLVRVTNTIMENLCKDFYDCSSGNMKK